MTINVSLDEKLIEKIDERAKAMYISRSAYISMALAEKMRQDDLVANIPEMISLMKDFKSDFDSSSLLDNGKDELKN